MATAGQRLAAAVQAAAEEERQMLGEHPSPDQLIAYQERRLSPEDAAPLKNHLALCPSCASTVADLESFPRIEPRSSVPEGQHPEPPEQLEGVLAELRKAGAFRPSGPLSLPSLTPLSTKEPTARVLSPPRWRMPATLAASLILAMAGAAFWFGTLWPSAPTTPPALVATAAGDAHSLEPRGFRTTRESLAPRSLPVAADAELLLLGLALPQEISQPRARVEVVDSAGKILWSADSASRRQDGTYKIQLPLALVPEGALEIRLFAVGSAASSAAKPFAVYAFLVETLPES